MLKGMITALVTPFIGEKLDAEGLAKNICFQLAQGVEGLVVLGTTGETPTLSLQEQEKVIDIAVAEVRGRVPVIAGTGSFCTQQTIEKTKKAKKLGADIALIVTPYYNRPSQEGIFRHFAAITEAVDIPLLIYNIPARAGVNIETATLQRIAALPQVIAVKESSGSVSQMADAFHAVSAAFPHFTVLCGDDALALPMISLGAKGLVSVVSNLIPASIAALVQAALLGDFSLARQCHFQLLPLFKALFIETNPVPIKEAMTLCGMAAGPCRSPLAPLAAENRQAIRLLLRQMGLLPA